MDKRRVLLLVVASWLATATAQLEPAREPVGAPVPDEPRKPPPTTSGPRTTTMMPGLANSDPHYAILSPSVMRPGSSYDMSVTILKDMGQVAVTAVMFDGDDEANPLDTQTGTFTMDNPGMLVLSIPMALEKASYQLRVEVVGDTGSFNDTKKVEVEVKAKSFSIFIQTDKAMYKPGQTVKFRAIAVRPDLKPYKENMNIFILDPHENRIDQMLDQSSPFGVVNGSLRLSSEPVLGLWKIQVEAYGQKTEKEFEVAEYVLPKFEVSVNVPSFYVVYTNRNEPMDKHEDFEATISARYTYGQPVKGTARVTVQIKPWGDQDRGHYTQKIFTRQLDGSNDGTMKIRMTIEELSMLSPPPPYRQTSWQPHSTLPGREFLVHAEVNETITGNTISENDTTPIHRQKYQVKFLEITPPNYKPGLMYTGFVQMSQMDDSPPEARDLVNETCKITATMYYKNDYTSAWRSPLTEALDKVIPASGLMSFSIRVGDDHTTLNFNVRCFGNNNNQVSAYKSGVEKFKSAEDRGIQVSLADAEASIKPGVEVTFLVRATESIEGFSYMFMSKGNIVQNRYVTASPAATDHELMVTMTSDLAQKLAPSARISVWYLTPNGEIITDSLELKVEGVFINDVSIAFEFDTRKPGEDNRLTVRASAESYVGLLAVDQSVLLLKGGNDVDQDDVMEDLKLYDPSDKFGGGPRPMPMFRGGRAKRSIWWPIPSGGSDSSEIFENAGITVITDAFIYKEPEPDAYYYLPMDDAVEIMPDFEFDAGAEAPAGRVDDAVERVPDAAPGKEESAPVDQPKLQEVKRTRTLFPETWIWADGVIGANEEMVITYTVPDTITSWVTSAFAMNDNVGMGIADNLATMTTFKPFFVSLNLPYSIIRGEEFSMMATVFNYMSTDQQVVVTLKESRDRSFGIRKSQNDILPVFEAKQVILTVKANEAANAYFWIVAEKLGQIPIEVQAQSPSAADALVRRLLVEPEGIPQEYSTSLMMQLDSNTPTYEAEIIVSLPGDDVVPDSAYFEVTAIGDIMGSSISGLDSLIRMPYGCGEQNMLNFAPNIYILQYLEETDQATSEIKTKSMDYMKEGYQRELRYQRIDGSFSAFGDSDDSGSLWLSAFVIRCFKQAEVYITVSIDKRIQTLVWIVDHQYEDGQFQEPGRVIHTDMQGGSSDGLPMTAYALLALLENDEPSLPAATRTRVAAAIAKTLNYLEDKIEDSLVSKDVFAMSIITYALHLAGSAKMDLALEKLEALATTKDGMTYWVVDEDDEPVATHDWRPPYHQAGASNIESTSYALLTYAYKGEIIKAMNIAKWLVKQRNPNGGFSSTQDTVVALQALAEFAALSSGGDSLAMDIHIEAGELSHDFDTLTSTNSIILQSVEPPKDTELITVTANGNGVGLVQVNVKYNIFDLASKPDMVLTVTSSQDNEGIVDIELCNKWTSKKESGMVVTEMNLLSGHRAINVAELRENTSGLKRVEVNGKTLAFYFDEVNVNAELCFHVKTKSEEPVVNLQQARVATYPYYSPDKRSTGLYLPQTAALTMCEACRECCDGDMPPVVNPGESRDKSTPEPTDPSYPGYTGGSSPVAMNAVAMVMTFCMATLLSLLVSF